MYFVLNSTASYKEISTFNVKQSLNIQIIILVFICINLVLPNLILIQFKTHVRADLLLQILLEFFLKKLFLFRKNTFNIISDFLRIRKKSVIIYLNYKYYTYL